MVRTGRVGLRVIEDWLEGRTSRGRTLFTDGWSLWSYETIVARKCKDRKIRVIQGPVDEVSLTTANHLELAIAVARRDGWLIMETAKKGWKS